MFSVRILLICLFFGFIAGAQDRPNIILFLVDDMGWQDTSVPFWKEVTPFNRRYYTPNMERLAREGMKFTQAYAHAVCSPTRVSLMTGMSPARHRVTNWTLYKNKPTDWNDEEIQIPDWNMNGLSTVGSIERTIYANTLPQLLKKAGYTTIHAGKAHFAARETPCADPLKCGFDINIAGHAAGAPGSYYGTDNFGNEPDGSLKIPWGVPGLSEFHGKDINLTEALTQRTIEALGPVVNAGEPFYLYMSHYTVHAPIQADKRFFQKYLETGLDTVEARYASMIEGMDKSLGDLMDYVASKNIQNNTVIIFMSDNGGLSALARGGAKHTHNRPLSSGKGSAHEGGIREPMLVKWPGVVQPGSVCSEYVIIEDFFPTILEIAKVDNPQTVQIVDGVSFIPMLYGKEISMTDRPLIWHMPNIWGPSGPGIGPSSTIRLGDWKLIYYHKERGFELFNIQDDIAEQNNLVQSQRGKGKELVQLLTRHLVRMDAQMPLDKSTGQTIPYPAEVFEKMSDRDN